MSTSLDHIPTDELINELKKRGIETYCDEPKVKPFKGLSDEEKIELS